MKLCCPIKIVFLFKQEKFKISPLIKIASPKLHCAPSMYVMNYGMYYDNC